MSQARSLAGDRLLPVAFTFRNHPASVVGNGSPPLLTTFEERCQLLATLGMTVVWTDFSLEFSQHSPSQFIQQILVQKLQSVAVVTGDNYRFGHKATGNPKLLSLCSQFRASVVPDVVFADKIISSSRIRQALAEGQVEDVQKMLGRSFCIENQVIEGQKLGRQLGMPTANLQLPVGKAVPLYGVYAVWAKIGDGPKYPGVASLGVRPTLDQRQTPQPLLEVHLIDTSANLYGQQMKVDFSHFLRTEQKFDNLDGLQEQMHKDKEQAKALLKALH